MPVAALTGRSRAAVGKGTRRQAVAADDGAGQPEGLGPGDTGIWVGLNLPGLCVELKLGGAGFSLAGFPVGLGVGRQLAREGPGLYPGKP